MDDFLEVLSNATRSASDIALLSTISNFVVKAPVSVLVSIALVPFVLIIATRLLTGRASENIAGKDGRSVWMKPYWVPVLGHGFQLYKKIARLKFLES